MEEVILVDRADNAVGTAGKMETHRRGWLHRAFSIFVFNTQGQLMLQKRQSSKYHCGGLWSNTCCSHPRAGEKLLQAAYRRLQEEMGIHCKLKELFSFYYRVEFDNGLIENEIDHVLVGHHDGEPVLNPEEAEDWKWISLEDLREDIRKHPDQYTYWFKKSIDRVATDFHRQRLAPKFQ